MQKLFKWIEIPATDIKRAVNFYNAVFGLNLKIDDFGAEKMACFPNNEGAISQSPLLKPTKDGTLVSIDTNNELDATIDRIKSNGGTILTEKTKIQAEGWGYFAVFLDSEGNSIGLYGNC